jgi:putative ABC transport system ATP-binding protein
VLTAMENIEFSMMLLGIGEKERRDRALKLLDELDIKELADKRPNDMSGGQQQRVAAARAIINNPAVVLADEPTANLDSTTGGILMDMMKRMNTERNITFIFSSHDRLVIDRAERLVMLKDGMIEK